MCPFSYEREQSSYLPADGVARRRTWLRVAWRRANWMLLAAVALVGFVTFGLLQTQAVAAVASQDPWAGQKIIVTTPGEVRLREGTRTVDTVDNILGVSKQSRGDWIYVVMNDSRKGWLPRKDLLALSQAEEVLTERIRRDPSDSNLFYLRGFARRLNGDLPGALADANVSVRMSPQDPVNYNGRGNVWLEMKEYDRALEDYNMAIRLAPVHAFYYYNAGLVRLEMKEYDQAIANFNQAIQRKAKYSDAYAKRGEAWKAKEEYLRAYADYGTALQYDPESWAKGSRSSVAWNLEYVPDSELRAYRPRDADEFSDRAQAWLRKGDLRAAEADYTAALRQWPNDGVTYEMRGWVHYLQGNNQQALADLSASIQAGPHEDEWGDTCVRPYLYRALVRLREKNYSAAIVDLTAAIESIPDDFYAHLNRAWAHYKLGDYPAAIADSHAPFGTGEVLWDYDEWSDTMPIFHDGWSDDYMHPSGADAVELAGSIVTDDAFVLTWRGQFYAMMKETRERARAEFDRAIDVDPKFALTYVLRGQLRSKQGDHQGALDDFTRAIEVYPDYSHAWYYRALEWNTSDEVKNKRPDFDKAEELGIQHSGFYVDRGWAAYEANEYEVALADFGKAIALEPRNGRAYAFRGAVLSAQDKDELALADFAKAMEVQKYLWWPWSFRALLHEKRGEFALATSDFEKAIEMVPKEPAPKNSYAWMLATCPDQAYRDAARAVELSREANELSEWKDPNHLETLAAAYAASGNFDEAVTWQTKAMELAPEGDRARLEVQLERYQSKQPYQEP